MTPLWMVFLVVAAGPGEARPESQGPSAVAPQSPPGDPRPGRELSEAVQAALRRWARPSGENAEQAAREFLALYRELEQDRSLGISTRQQLRMKVRARLAQLAEQIAKRAAQDNGKAAPPETLASPPEKQEQLAQLGGPNRGQAGGRAAGGLAGQAGRGGPGVGVPRGPSQNFGLPDSGLQLVEVIHRTIAPSTWDVNGGPGTIRYWRPGPALVIRQTSEVHGDVADFVDQLQRMGR